MFIHEMWIYYRPCNAYYTIAYRLKSVYSTYWLRPEYNGIIQFCNLVLKKEEELHCARRSVAYNYIFETAINRNNWSVFILWVN